MYIYFYMFNFFITISITSDSYKNKFIEFAAKYEIFLHFHNRLIPIVYLYSTGSSLENQSTRWQTRYSLSD